MNESPENDARFKTPTRKVYVLYAPAYTTFSNSQRHRSGADAGCWLGAAVKGQWKGPRQAGGVRYSGCVRVSVLVVTLYNQDMTVVGSLGKGSVGSPCIIFFFVPLCIISCNCT